MYVGREHRDHVSGNTPQVLQVAEPGQSCDVAPREGWKSQDCRNTGGVYPMVGIGHQRPALLRQH